MKIIDATLYDYKSIIKTQTKFQEDVTCLVGVTGAGKTSILELLQRIDDQHGFNLEDLPEKSETRNKFLSNMIPAEEILQIEVKFLVEEADKENFPKGFENVEAIKFKRFFDGSWVIELVQTGESTEPPRISLDDEIDLFSEIFTRLKANIIAAKPRVPKVEQHVDKYDTYQENFIKIVRENPKELAEGLANFTNSLNTIPHDAPLKQQYDAELAQLQGVINTVNEKLKQDPMQLIYETIPKPQFIPDLPELVDKIPLDDYLNNPDNNEIFKAIGMICDFNKPILNNIRNSEDSSKRNFFDDASKKLTNEFKDFWTQVEYELLINLADNELTFSVKDAITKGITKATQRSEGLKWVLALFFKIKTLVASKGLSHILLFDSPATAVHDAGKEEIRKYLTKMAEQNHLQIIYTTHEKALINPWKLDRIRFVKKEENVGTTIHEVKSNGIDSTRVEISKHIGSPAKYSLFGAPMIIHFEGPSDYRFVAALNEYAIEKDRKFLHPDVFSIDEMGGIDNSKNIMKICKDLGLDFCLVVDGGSKAISLASELGDDFEKYFIKLTEVINKNAVDIEDLIDPELYHHLFKLTYKYLDVPDKADIIHSEKKDSH